jgi:alkanesulfonate monooxygenase SsuD/methylene tetrahydromethanopterin reductase-like flavin-dependent oxidoreductase (luciferase family)
MTDLGVIFRPQVNPPDLRAAVTTADAAGLDEFWLWEDCFDHGGVATLSAALAWSERIRVGIGLLPVPLRNPALTAMEVASLAQLFPGRAEIGLGHGVAEWMDQVGAKVGSPMTLLREYTDAVRRLVHNETVDVDGRYVQLRDVHLGWAPLRARPRLHVGAVGPKTVALAGEVADGLILTAGTTPDQLREKRAVYDAARGDRAGRVTVFVIYAGGPEASSRFEQEARAWELEPSDDIGVWGTPERVAGLLQRWVDAGADSVVLQPTPDLDVGRVGAWAAEHVRPLLH